MVRERLRKVWARPYGLRARFVHLTAAALILSAPDASGQPQGSPGEVHILALGDSLTAGFGLPERQGFVPQLQSYLRRHGLRARVVNGGVSGDTAEQGLARLDWALDGMGRKPDVTIIALGANDMLRGINPDQTRQALDSLLAELKRRGSRVVLAGMVAAPNLGPDFATRFNALYPDLARTHGATLLPFFLEGVAGERSLNQPDGIHPNLAGVRIMVAKIAPLLLQQR